jgi:hypothetical protein
MENAAALKNLQAEQASATDALQQKVLEFEKKSRRHRRPLCGGPRRYRRPANALDDLLKKQGIEPGEKSQRVEAFRAAGYQQIDFEALQE